MNTQLKTEPIAVGEFVAFDFNGNEYQGKVRQSTERYCIVDFLMFGAEREIQVPIASVKSTNSLLKSWWTSIVDPLSEEVLGDSEPDLTKIDAIGRGKKGFGHGSIDWKPISRKRKNGRVWRTVQPWYQWEDEKGKHCRYLRKGTDLVVQKLIDSGANVEAILDTIGQDKNERKRKTR